MSTPSPRSPSVRFGIDVGGTFTDLSAFDPVRGRVRHHKVLTTPHDPVEGILLGLAGLRAIAEIDATAWASATIVHGTTLATNALIERRGARVGLLTTDGARDVLETGKENRYDPYDRLLVRPAPLVPRELRRTVSERILASGAVHRPLDEAEVAREVAALVDAGVETLAVSLLHSYANPAHERAIRDVAARVAPDLAVTISSELAPVLGEWERVTTTVANAFVLRLVEGYLRRLRDALGREGHAGAIFLMGSDGGFASIDATLAMPLRLLESGPAAGALATCALAEALGERRVIAFDMGGTTAKMTLVRDFEAERASTFEVGRVHRHMAGSGLTVRVPSVHMLEIGAGGGSIAGVDELGLLTVGPRSAGASPGPACYGLGGEQPTVTDANLRLGYLNADARLAGDLALRPDLTEVAFASLAETLGESVDQVASRVRRVVGETMAQAVKLHATEQGEDPASFTLVAFGGAAPLHAYDVARALGIAQVVLPLQAGVLSASGLMAARPGVESVQSIVAPLTDLPETELAAVWDDLRARTVATLASSDVAARDIAFRYSLDLRYRGQGYEMTIPIDPAAPRAAIAASFVATYQERYGVDVTGEIEIRACRLWAEGPAPRVPREDAVVAPVAAAVRSRPVFFEEAGGFVVTPVYRVESFPVGVDVAGPLVIEAPHTTFVVGPSGRVRLTGGQFELSIARVGERAAEGSAAAPERTLDLEILLARLRAIADEADRALLRTAFSSVVRDGKDYSLVIADPEGTCLALPTECMPLFVTSMPRTMRLIAERFPPHALESGDVIVTNDPWLCAGHKSDVVLIAPVFVRGRLVATIGTILHVADIGGTLGDFRAWDVFEEGLMIPPMKLSRGGRDDESLLALLAANVRTPELVLGDVNAMRSAIRVASRRIEELLVEDPDLDLSAVGRELAGRAGRAFAAALARVPHGRYGAAWSADGLPQAWEPGEAIRFALSVTSHEGGLLLDFAGTDGQRARQPINVPMAYTLADAVYTLQYLLAPHVPNVGPQFIPVVVDAPDGTILNAQPPVPVFARTRTGLHVPTLINLALAEALPDVVQAGCGHNVIVNVSGVDERGRYFHLNTMPKGGMGATGGRDGWHVTAFPTNDTTTPIEVAEGIAPVVIHKEILCDSGGAGRERGGAGQRITFTSVASSPLVFSYRPNFEQHPAPGLLGGRSGAPVTVTWNGRPVTENPLLLAPGDVCAIETAGGGGIGDPWLRDPALVAADVAAGVVSAARALADYGVALTAAGGVDAAGTAWARGRMA